MTFAIRQINEVLRQRQATQDARLVGRVMSVTKDSVVVATARGALTVRNTIQASVGDRVIVQNQSLTRAPVARKTFGV
jgi:hypothetical protein